MSILSRTMFLAVLTAALIAGAAAPAAAAEPTRKVSLGVSDKAGLSATPTDDLAAVDAFTDSVGRAPAIWSIWSDWGGANRAFPNTTLLNGLRDRGVAPMIMWQPIGPGYEDGRYRLQEIKDGAHDAYITQYAQAAKAWGGKVLLRFAHEMNGYWFPWGVDQFNNTPEKFKKAWKHVWGIFDSVGAKNVKFIWSPMKPCGGCASYSSVYPGDAYVKFASFSAFNWGEPQRWKSMLKVFTQSMDALAQVTSKKVIVGETASARDGGDKAAWIRDGYPAVYKSFPKLKGIVYFNLDMRILTNGEQPNWLLTDPAGALDAYRFILGQPRFQGAIL